MEGEGGVFGGEGFDPCGLFDGVVSMNTVWRLTDVMEKMTEEWACMKRN